MKRMTKFSMYVRMVFNFVIRRRSRMLVALLAVAIGAAVLSGLAAIYYDVPRQMGREFRSYGANLIFTPGGSSQFISEEELRKASKLLPAEKVLGVAPYLYNRVKVNEQPLLAAGTEFEQVKEVSPYWQLQGNWPEKNTQGVIVGAEVAKRLDLELGQEITLVAVGKNGKVNLMIEGIVKTGGAEENYIFVDLPILQKLFSMEGQVSVVQVSITAPEEELSEIAQQLEGQFPGLTPQLVKRITQSEGIVLSKLRALVYLITIIVLLLTFICVATTMIAVVSERRKEIGLKKALGAENKSIILEFLGESFALGTLGGLLGTVLGFGFAYAVSLNVFGRPISFQPLIAPVALLISITVSGAACLIPVKVATDIEPAIVLRGE